MLSSALRSIINSPRPEGAVKTRHPSSSPSSSLCAHYRPRSSVVSVGLCLLFVFLVNPSVLSVSVNSGWWVYASYPCLTFSHKNTKTHFRRPQLLRHTEAGRRVTVSLLRGFPHNAWGCSLIISIVRKKRWQKQGYENNWVKTDLARQPVRSKH